MHIFYRIYLLLSKFDYICIMNDTRSEIIRLGSELIRSIGYNSFSYADISKALNIKNAAIHYYFPSKSDLGVEIIRRNLNAFNELTKTWESLDLLIIIGFA